MHCPVFIISWLLASLGPFLLILPFRNKDNTPNHHYKTIKEVSRAIFCSVLPKIVEQYSGQSNNGGEDEPRLKEWDEIKVCLWIGTNIAFNTVWNNISMLRSLVDRHKFYVTSMPHNISEWENKSLLVEIGVFSLYWKIQQIVVLCPQLFFRSKQRAILIFNIFVNFIHIECWVFFLFLDFLVLRKLSSSTPFQIAT